MLRIYRINLQIGILKILLKSEILKARFLEGKKSKLKMPHKSIVIIVCSLVKIKLKKNYKQLFNQKVFKSI
jgi:hypothetical protein